MKFIKQNAAMFFKSIAMAMLVAFSFSSCEKDKDQVQVVTPSIEGQYTGKYGFGNEVPVMDQKYKLISGGTIQEIGVNSGTVIGEGSWSKTGNTFTATYTMNFAPFDMYSLKGSFDPATKKMTGTWGFDNSETDGGKFEWSQQ